jgi:hypothetical protein
MFGLGVQELLLLVIIGLFVILPYWKIFSKAGFSGWWSLTLIIPILNFVILFYLAFAEWPVHRELRRLQQLSTGPVA